MNDLSGTLARDATAAESDAASSEIRPRPAAVSCDHHVQFYEGEDTLVDHVAAFLIEGLAAGDPVTIIATREHNTEFEQRVGHAAFDTAAARERGQLIVLDAHETLATFMRDDEPDPALFEAAVGGVIARQAAIGPGRSVRAYGEMVDVLWKQGSRRAALRLEELWNDLQDRYSFRLYCAYAMASFYKEPSDLQRVCALHTHVVDGGGVSRESAGVLAREIAQRKEVERALRDSLRELRAKEDALHETAQQLQLITDSLPVLVSYVDAEQRYRFVSAAYERWFARPRAAIVGKHLQDALGEEAYEAIRKHAERALGGETTSYGAEVTYGDGRTRCIEATYVPHVSADGDVSGFVALVNDVTERKKFEGFRLAAATRAEKTLRITGAIADAVTDAEVFEALVDRVHEALEATSAALWLVDEGAGTAGLVRALGYTEPTRQRLQSLPLDLTPSLPAVDSMRSGEPLWIESQAELIRRYPHLEAMVTPGRSYRVCCLPLVAHGRVLGTLGLTIDKPSDAPEEEREFLLLVARYASQAVERLRLFEAERRSRAAADRAAVRLGLLSHASRVFAETDLDLPSRLRGIVRELGTVLESCVGIALVGADNLLNTSAVYHPVPEAEQLLLATGRRAPLRVGEGVTGGVVATGKSVLIAAAQPAEVAARAAPAYRSFLERFPTYAMVCVPLRAREQVIGAVTATRTRPGETYAADDLQLVEQLAERAAVAIENSRLYQETRESRNRAEQLYRFAQTVVVAEKVETVFEAALGAIEAALGVKRAAILTFDESGVMRFVAWRNLSETYRRAVEGHSPWAPDAKTPEPVLVPDAARDATLVAYGALFRAEGIAALAFIPLVTRGRLLGKFMLYYEEPHTFTSQELETAAAIGNHLASVMTRFNVVTRLEETLRSNELFAGVLAHDLRNPLAAMMTAARLLVVRYDNEGRSSDDIKPLSRILSSGDRMSRLIDQLLDFTRARTGGGIELQPREADLGELCAHAIEEIELAHPSWRIQSEITDDPHGHWDPDRLLQAISNLLANAGQHGTADGGIRVNVDGSHPDHVSVEVHNWGTVPAPLLPHLFEPFRTTSQGTRSSRGLGLGLFIVREIVRAHGGTVSVASSDAVGTTFTVLLPRNRVRTSKSEPVGA